MSHNDLNKVIKNLQNAIDHVNSLNGQTYDPKGQPVFLEGGPMLHQDTDEMTKYESAEIERNNQDAVNFIRDLASEFHKRLSNGL